MPAAVLAVLAAVLLAAAALAWSGVGPSTDDRAAAGASAPSPVVATPATTPGAPTARRPSPTALPGAGAPHRVLIESLGVDAPVLSIVTEGQSLDPPADPQSLGWWSQGARPGAARGTALLTGHTVHDGGGALDNLEDLVTGSSIRVLTEHGQVRYVADSVVVLDKETIARKASQLFSQEVAGRLVLVTCEGWDGTGYRSNVVVTATPVA